MVQKIQCYEDASGKLHKSALDAWRADLAIWFARSEDVSETSARKLADRIAGDRGELDELVTALEAIRSEMPPMTEAAHEH